MDDIKIMSNPNLYYHNTQSSQSATITTTKTKKPFQLSPATIWITAAIIIIIIIIIAVVLSVNASSEKETINNPVESQIINLDNLINLDPKGLCCKPPSQNNTSLRYIFDPDSKYTYSFVSTDPKVVCQSFAGQENNTCLAFVSNSDGSSKPLAHKGIVIYYAFAPGQASSVCESYISCT